MRGEFDQELEPERPRRDTELTLSSATLLAIFFGLVLLCGLFFGLGFTVGRNGPKVSSPAGQQPPADTQLPPPETGSRPKPSAAPQFTPGPQRAVVNLPPSSSSDANTAASPQHSDAAAATGQPIVKPALPPPSQSASAPKAEPSTALGAALMVQIAAVSHQEDAEVLVSALRKRGYRVTVRRQPSDSMLHVQIGPFTNRNEANAMRQKLLNDGYNAILEP